MNSLEKPTIRSLLGDIKNSRRTEEESRARRRAGRFSSLRPGKSLIAKSVVGKSMVKSYPSGRKHLVTTKASGTFPIYHDSLEEKLL